MLPSTGRLAVSQSPKRCVPTHVRPRFIHAHSSSRWSCLTCHVARTPAQAGKTHQFTSDTEAQSPATPLVDPEDVDSLSQRVADLTP